MYISTSVLAAISALAMLNTARHICLSTTLDPDVAEVIDHLNVTKTIAIDMRNDVYSLNSGNFMEMLSVRCNTLFPLLTKS